MYVKIRKIGAKPGENDCIIHISKKAKIEEFREMIEKELEIQPEEQMLLYKGKQLVNGHKIMDYDIQLNDVIQLMIKLLPKENDIIDNIQDKATTKMMKKESDTDTTSQYYKLGDLIDVKLSDTGAWYEAKITKIFKRSKEGEESENNEKDLHFRVKRFEE